MQAGRFATPATGGEADTFATATKLGLYVCSMILAPICNIAILMQGESAAVSRFVLLLYTTQLYVRYWIQLGAVDWQLVMAINIAGLVVDAAVCFETIYLNLVVRQPGDIEIQVVVITAAGSAVVCFLGLVHLLHQLVVKRKTKGN